MDAAQPIIVKRIKKHGHGHHGGAWKVAFADFVTAMMAFFLLMWLMGSTTPEQKEAISDFFQNPSAVQGPGGASTSMIKLGATDANPSSEGTKSTPNPNDQQSQTSDTRTEIVEREVMQDKQRLDSLKQELEQAIDASVSLKDFKDQLLLDITPEGLRIQIIDKENRPMFDSGSSHLKSYTATILLEFAKLINKVPNKISLTGHTDATPFNSARGYTNWELSTDRANSSRRALVRGGLNKSKIAKVVGLSSTILFDKSNPTSPINRRISMIVLNKQAEQALLMENNRSVGSSQQLDSVLNSAQQPKGEQSLNKLGTTPANTGRNLNQPTMLGAPKIIKSPKNDRRPVSLGTTPKKQIINDPANPQSTLAEEKPQEPVNKIEPIRLPIKIKK